MFVIRLVIVRIELVKGKSIETRNLANEIIFPTRNTLLWVMYFENDIYEKSFSNSTMLFTSDDDSVG